jgi:hypothetical protein
MERMEICVTYGDFDGYVHGQLVIVSKNESSREHFHNLQVNGNDRYCELHLLI